MKKQIINEKFKFDDEGLDAILLGIGFIPVLGEIADIIQIFRYYRKKEYIYMALTCVALIPTVGDMIAVPFIGFLRGLRAVRGASGATKTMNYAAKIATNEKMSKFFIEIIPYFTSKKVKDFIQQIGRIPVFGKKLKNGIMSGINYLRVIRKQLYEIRKKRKFFKQSPSSGVNYTKTAYKSFSRQYKDYFRKRVLRDWIAKNPNKTPNLMRRLLLRYLASWQRRKLTRNFIQANKILEFFNFPNIESFERWLRSNDPSVEERLLSNPQLRQHVDNNTTQEDLDSLDSKSGTAEKKRKGPSLFGTMMTLAFLKAAAKKLLKP